MERPDPFSLFDAWFAEARTTEINDSNAMALATTGADGQPSVRMVLLKGHGPDLGDHGGFVFYTNFESRKAMQLAVGLIHRHAATIVPVRTGRLKNSLFWDADYERQGNTIVGAVGTNVEYAPYVEFGTRRMSARPYLRPAVENNANAINSIFASEIGNALHG